LKTVRRRWGTVAGQASVELAGGALVVLLAGLVIAQLFLGGQQRLRADAAAKTGALAVVEGEDPRAAVRAALPGRSSGEVEVRSRPAGDHMVRVEVSLPPAGPFGSLGLVPPVKAAATAGSGTAEGGDG